MSSTIIAKLKTTLLILTLSILSSQLIAQTNTGIFFQAVARDNFSNPAKDRKIYVQSSVIQTTPTGTKVLTEEHQATTDATGVFSISIGNGTRVGGTATGLSTIDWSKGPFYLNLKVAITPVASDNGWDHTKEWIDMGTTSFGAVPFALYSANAGGVDQKVNIFDTTKMLAVYAKAIAVKTLETSLATKLNIADSLTGYITPSKLASKTFDTANLSNRINLKLNANQLGVANGVASLNAAGMIPSSQLPPVSLSSTSVVANEAAMLALTSATVGSIAVRTDLNKNYVLSAAGPSVLSNWVELLTAGAPVQSVNGYTGSVNITKSAIGLNEVDNISDINKLVSNATQAALNLKLDVNKLGVASGAASLNALGKIPSDQMPAISFSILKVISSQAEMLALSSAEVGTVVIRTDVNKNYVLANSNPALLANWIELLTPAPPVQNVNGYTGTVNITKSDIGLSNTDNTSDVNKPVSVATQTALNLKSNVSDVTILTTALGTKLNITDTASLLKKVDTANLSNRINLKLNANQLGVANGVASLNALGIIPSSQLPPVSLSSTSVVASEADMLALNNASVGSIAIRTDVNKNYILSTSGPSVLANWVELLTPGAPVQSVNGYTGSVSISKSDLGIGEVNNTTDINKPISTATQNALNLKLDANKLGVASGAASLNALGKIPTDQIPAISFSSVKVLNSEREMLALSSAVIGSVVIRTDVNKNYVLATANPAVLANWVELLTPAPPVQTVNGYSGIVSLTKSDIGLSNADNTSDANKSVSTAMQTALDLKASKTFVTNAITSGNYTNTSDITTLRTNVSSFTASITSNTTDISLLKTSVASNTVSTTLNTAAIALKAPLYLVLRNADAFTIGDANSGNIIYTQWNTKPIFPESLADGFNCTIVNYSGGAITSNVLTNAKFYTNTSGYAGTSSYTIPAGGSVNVYAIKILSGGVLSQRFYILSGDQSTSSVTGYTGTYNVGLGFNNAGIGNGTYNTAIGNNSMQNNTTGTYNTAIGNNAMINSRSMAYTTALGAMAGQNLNTGNNNTFLGYAASLPTGSTISNATAIGSGAIVYASNTIRLGANGLAGTTAIDSVLTTGTLTAGSVTYPKSHGINGQVLSTTGSGTLTWTTISSTSNASTLTGTVTVLNGGTGATNLTGYLIGNGTNAFTSSSKIPASDITGLIKSVNGSLPDFGTGNIAIAFGTVATGTLANRPLIPGTNGSIYVVSGDATTADNGRTYISDGTYWNEVTSNQAATDARYLQLAGGTLSGNLIIPTAKVLTITDAPSNNTDATNKSYVDAAISNVIINDATSSSAGKIRLGGDLAGLGSSATDPKVGSVGGSTAAQINTAEVLANGAVSTSTANQIVKRDASGNFDANIITANLTGNVTGNITGNVSGTSNNVTGIVSVSNGGTGTYSLTGYVKGNGSTEFTASSTIPASDITGLIKKVNGSTPDTDGNVAISFGTVSTGTLASRPINAGINGNIYVVSADITTAENGRTFISDGTNWKEVTSNQSATDARYLKLAGGTMAGNIVIPASSKITLTDAPSNSLDAVNKAYVDLMATSSTIANTTSSTLGKIQLGGDLAGVGTSATSPIISSVGGSTASLINTAEIAANAATYSNTANQIVKRDAGGNFSANTITANIIGNVSGNATNVSGIVSGANGGTGVANSGKTITLGGNLTISGTYATTLTVTGPTTLTIPTSGTLATLAQVDLKELTANKSTDVNLGLSNNPTSLGDTKYPTQNAVKTYVDGKVSNISAVGTITSGTWSASAISVSKGGTGLTAAGSNGQFLTSTAAGTLTWTTVASGGGNTHSIGEQYGGGIVFYTWDNGVHGLVVAKNELGSKGPLDYTSTAGVKFLPGTGYIATAFRSGVGAGSANTNNIIARTTYYEQQFAYAPDPQYHNIYAALLAQQYTNTTNASTPLFGDWYLPSMYELGLLKTNLTLLSGSGFNVNHDYWSSTEVNQGYAYYYKSSDPNSFFSWTANTATLFVIPIRQF